VIASATAFKKRSRSRGAKGRQAFITASSSASLREIGVDIEEVSNS
jgi:hypothetical protein